MKNVLIIPPIRLVCTFGDSTSGTCRSIRAAAVSTFEEGKGHIGLVGAFRALKEPKTNAKSTHSSIQIPLVESPNVHSSHHRVVEEAINTLLKGEKP